jgi:hypothetical protein
VKSRGGLLFVGLDIETTGSNIEAGAGICQVGVYSPTHQFVSDIRPHAGYAVTEEAMGVNGFTHERLEAGAPLLEVDEGLSIFLGTLAPEGNHRRIIPIGWNVAGFDMGFIRRFLPRSFEWFSYRSVDLNAICFTMDPSNWKDYKRASKQYAGERMEGKLVGYTEKRAHDALYDAAQGYYAWHYLRSLCQMTTANAALDIERSRPEPRH